MKQCRDCALTLPFSSFYTNGYQPKSKKQKYHASCKICMEKERQTLIQEKKKIIFELFGDSCRECGYNKCFAALEFHHTIPTEKEYPIAVLLNNFSSVGTMIIELSKCIMLCANCHRELHSAPSNSEIYQWSD